MDVFDLLSRFAVALGIGLLIGVERGWRTREAEGGSRAAGIRTFTISGLLGGVTGALALALGGSASAGGGLVLGLGLAAFAAVFALFCREENRAEQQFSATTAIAGMVTFALGAYALIGDMRVAVAVAVATAALLALREPMHDWVGRLTWPELRSMLVLLAMTFIALPIMPDEPVGPFGGVNPRAVWLIAIVLAGVSFVGYAAVKYFGASLGVLIAGAAGGLASSTAVTVANARRAAAGEGEPRLLAAGVALASAIMFLRVGAIVIAINASLVPLVAAPLIAAAVVATAYAVVGTYRFAAADRAASEVKFRNPFAFWPVVGFALFLGAVIVIGKQVGESFGAAGAMLGAAIVGLVDVDAITVSMARLVPGTLGAHEAALAILVAVTTDTLSKIGIGAAIGRGRFALEIAIMAALSLAAGGIAALITYGFAAT
jgi:uncharacterized membrane protein (DUF4010 family)